MNIQPVLNLVDGFFMSASCKSARLAPIGLLPTQMPAPYQRPTAAGPLGSAGADVQERASGQVRSSAMVWKVSVLPTLRFLLKPSRPCLTPIHHSHQAPPSTTTKAPPPPPPTA